jgi:hypothetical protein
MAKQFWGNKKIETANAQSLVADDTWCIADHFQGPFMSRFSAKVGNKDYYLSGQIEQSGEQSAKLKTSESALKRKYS